MLSLQAAFSSSVLPEPGPPRLPPQDGGVGQVLLPEDVGEAGGAEVPPQLVLLGVREHGHVVQLEAGGREVLQDGLGKRI